MRSPASEPSVVAATKSGGRSGRQAGSSGCAPAITCSISAASATLRESPNDTPPEAGDPFPGQDRYVDIDLAGLSRAFGDSELSQAVFELPPHTWHGPLRSGYGWHVVHVEGVDQGSRRPFAEVRDALRADYLDEQRREINAAALAAIKEKYVVVREDQEP